MGVEVGIVNGDGVTRAKAVAVGSQFHRVGVGVLTGESKIEPGVFVAVGDAFLQTSVGVGKKELKASSAGDDVAS